MNVLGNETGEIRREGRKLTAAEFSKRCVQLPEKLELLDGVLYGSTEDCVAMLAFLLENVGVDRVVRIGDPAVWRAAVAELDRGTGPL